jgi:hypothetical protein
MGFLAFSTSPVFYNFIVFIVKILYLLVIIFLGIFEVTISRTVFLIWFFSELMIDI